MEVLTSKNNPLAVHIRKLNTQRAYRRSAGEFVCEGGKLLQEALRAKAKLVTVLAVEGAELPPLPSKVRAAAVSHGLMRSISDTETPQGILFTCRIPPLAPPDKLTGSRYMVLDGLQDPGNVGSIWRTAAAFESDGIFLLHNCADPFAPKTVRATMGAVFRLPVWETGAEELSLLLCGAGIPLWSAAPDSGAADVRGQSFGRAAVVIGSEGAGVSPELLSRSERILKIPMARQCESLNAAAAAAVLLWEMYR